MKRYVPIKPMVILVMMFSTASAVRAVTEADYQAIRDRNSTTNTTSPNYSWPQGAAVQHNYQFDFRAPGDTSLNQRYLDSAPSTTDVTTSGAASGGAVIEKYGTTTKLKTSVYQPMQGGGTMSTVNGATSFTAQLSCPQSTPFLDIFAVPAATGDISSLTVLQNIDMQGPPEHTVVMNNVSGVCANGFISCDPGTWANCAYNKWQVGPAPNFEFNYQPSQMFELVSCTCINNSCGSLLVFNNMNSVLNIIGGGIANSIMQVNPEAMLSNVVYNDLEVQFFGQKVSNCNILQSSPSASDAQYAADLSLMANNAEAAKTNHHLYTLVQNSPIAAQTSSANSSCNITRDFSVTQTVKGEIMQHVTIGAHNAQAQRYTYPANPNLGDFATLAGYNAVHTNNGYENVTLSSPNFGEARISATISYAGWGVPVRQVVNFTIDDLFYIQSGAINLRWIDDHANIYVNGTLVYSRAYNTNNRMGDKYVHYTACCSTDEAGTTCTDGNGWTFNGYVGYFNWTNEIIGCPRSGNQYRFENDWRATPNPLVDVTSLLVEGNNQIIIDIQVGNDGGSGVDLYLHEAETCVQSTWTSDSCDALRDRPECRLQDETIDGISTYHNFVPTGLAPLPSTQTKSTPRCTFPLTNDWWQTTQTYICQADPSARYNFDQALMREAHIRESAADQDYNGYEDYVPGAGGVMTAIQQGMTNRIDPNAATVETVCQTELRVDDDAVTVNGVSSEFRDPSTGQRIIKIYRPCINNVCPIETDETLLSDCQPMQNFGSVLTDVQLIRMSGKDLTCSSGNVVQPPEAVIPTLP